MSRRLYLLLGLVAWLAAGCSSSQQAPPGGAADPTPEELLRRVADFYRNANGFEVDLTQSTNVEAEGLKQEAVSHMQVVAQRPNRLAMHAKEGSRGIDLVSDGTDLYTSISLLGWYSKSPAPQNFDELLKNPQFMMLGMSGGRGPLLELLASDPYRALMEGVTTTKYEGRETIDGRPAHHVKFKQQFDWDLWVAAEGDPVVLQMSIDAGQALSNSGMAPKLFENMRVNSVQSYKNWRFGAEPRSDAFVFEPPPNAKERPSFLGGGRPQDLEKFLEGLKGGNAKPVAPAQPSPKVITQEDLAKQLNTDVEISNSQGLRLRLIPPGEFTMGSPITEPGRRPDEKTHRVQITKPFYLGIHEVTQKQYQDVTGFNPSHFSQQGAGKEAVQGTETSQLPVESETWFEAIDFCIQLSEREQLPPYYRHDGELVAILGGIGYRLPTEAEWEYACRAGTAACWSFGPDPEQLAQHAWFKSNSSSQTHPTGELMANPFGLFDMYGNAWEWCWDVFAEYPLSAASDPTGPEVGKGHVLRGGAFHDEPSYVRSASRGWNVPDKRNNSYGFRVARDCPDTH